MRAADIMTPRVITVSGNATIGEAIRLMLQNHISGLPVVDPAGNLAGVVTEGDFLRRAEDNTEKRRTHWLEFVLGPGRLADDYVRTHGRKVNEVMSRKLVTADENASVREIVRLMETKRVKRIPIVRGNKVVGIVSRANLLHVLGHLAATAKPTSKTDSDIRAKIVAELEKQKSWAPITGVNIIVHNGEVELKGAIFEERQREALKVAVENVPGVKAIHDHMVWVEPISGTTLDPPPETPVAAVR
jgi:CBS domain-containing protein